MLSNRASKNLFVAAGHRGGSGGGGGGFTRPISGNGRADQLLGVPIIGQLSKDGIRVPE